MQKKKLGGPVIVAGGGIGGTATAVALAQAGIEVLILEQASELREAGIGIQMPPNAFKVFDRLGLVVAMLKKAACPDDLVFMDALSGEQIIRIPVDDEFLADFKYPYALMHRGDLLEVLAQACRESDRIAIRTSSRVTGFRQEGGRVTVRTEDGAYHEGAALVGSDGLWSTMRRELVGADRPRTENYIIFRGVVPADQMPELEFANAVVMWGGPELNFSHYPMRSGSYFALGASVKSALALDQGVSNLGVADGARELRERFGVVCPAIARLLDKIDVDRMWTLHDREPIKHWSQGNVTLLGDAAHPTFNYMAQGACMALEDAVCLADCVTQADSYEQAFKAYQQARYLRTARVQLTSRMYGELYHAKGVQADLRNALLSRTTAAQARQHLSWLFSGI
ncbi:FAD-dependent monooxygenase [Variovorax sp. KK3]|uniref:FAD-dependent monooxygenase n=1 Tax=Variovorax sp. KK3 TaxID=1855728 RepID=UPI00097C5D8F|nr:FAD-dependent monooxygenase [Variovorax sp. KK3]